ncbi:SDR family NAD(P)-dependent oxidoreductase [Frankia sp. CNm7]|uniref:SDR family NAD(P)-dependent oxidoreductase n=1 Tax=Frankia nepalensis TaxID=1836974 RepID=A0A937URT9_9ACTN|nr:SDR family NAD(P)-dependent oxidoreductase [Frankia nepalensis]MBL7497827.1 SDR family NAD(P)-dependent oxidoreductase [Frankia nepalensis]MBL7515888.1 SDR family NAD(P)-dependent oxidoreductase [Frankia nepalensis]MBL7519799.1 SDR family NAD(P)-dependent oxidoreductase [Frankia nepalensis]MBL7631727.1 SDR family NAD(P)-dependent oxidoreductase [Frankia nepalensis]
MGEDRPVVPPDEPGCSTTRLAGRAALVTGASSGIGRAVALRLARAGAAVLGTARDRDALETLAKEADSAGLAVRYQPADLTVDEDRAKVAEAVRDQLGQLSVLVHCAGLYRRGGLAQAPLADLDTQFAVNVRAPYVLTQLLLPDLLRTRGDIVFVNSTQGLSASGGVGQYAATKHALRAAADSLRAELGDTGMRVCTIFPGRTATPMQEKVFEGEGRPWDPASLIHPEDIAEVMTSALELPPRAAVTDITILPAFRT